MAYGGTLGIVCLCFVSFWERVWLSSSLSLPSGITGRCHYPEDWILAVDFFFLLRRYFSANLWDPFRFQVAMLLKSNYSEVCAQLRASPRQLCFAWWVLWSLFVVKLHSTSSDFIDFFVPRLMVTLCRFYEHPSLLNFSWPRNFPFFSNLIPLLFILPGEF